MIYKLLYKTPNNFDDIILNSDGKYLTGLSFIRSKDFLKHSINCSEEKLPIFEETIKWLDIYFSGKNPNFIPKYKLNNLTPFKEMVTNIINKIPFGYTMTYGEIAKMVAKEKEIEKMSSQAIGGAVGANPICIIIPCHRVLGAKNSLTSYSGGINNKIALLENENIKFAQKKY